MGYRVHAFAPDEDSPAGQVADFEVTASYEDLDALRTFARGVDVVTFEVENVPIEAIDAIEALAPVRPSGVALHMAQHRAREKTFLADRGVPTAPFAAAATLDELSEAITGVGTPAMIKTSAFGYDGKDQHKATMPADVEPIWTAIGHQEAIVEKFISVQAEISVVAARGVGGQVVAYAPFENRRRGHILDLTTVPGAVAPPVAAGRSIWRARSSRSSSASVSCASSSSSVPTASCSSTGSRRDPTIPAIAPSTPP